MNRPTSTPYPRDNPDHEVWNRWLRAYFAQPVSGQLYDIATQLRSGVTALLESSADLLPPEGRQELRIHVCALEGIAHPARSYQNRVCSTDPHGLSE